MAEIFTIGLSLLPASILPKREALSAEARRILKRLGGRGAIIREGGGRPYFASRHADFSISHSRNMAAAALCKAPALRTGCDVQYIDERKNHVEISRRFFHESEQNYIEAGSGTEGARRFYRVWVLKEAWLKLRGLSVFEMQKAPVFSIGLPVNTGSAHLTERFFLYELETAEGGRYALAAAIQIFHAEKDFKFLSQRRRGAKNAENASDCKFLTQRRKDAKNVENAPDCEFLTQRRGDAKSAPDCEFLTQRRKDAKNAESAPGCEFLSQRRKDAENAPDCEFLSQRRGGAYSFAEDLPEPEFRWFSEPALAVSRVAEIYAAQRPANTVTPNR
jgi:hypothetical protein